MEKNIKLIFKPNKTEKTTDDQNLPSPTCGMNMAFSVIQFSATLG